MSRDPLPQIEKRLTGPLRNFYTSRVGSYRIMFTIDYQAQSVEVIEIGDRKEMPYA